MTSTTLSLLLLLHHLLLFAACSDRPAASFSENYHSLSWGGGRIQLLNNETEASITLDKAAGSYFASNHTYSSGFFRMKIKPPGNNSAGVVTAFFWGSDFQQNFTFVEFAFLGNIQGKNIILRTNVFENRKGTRDQRFRLWFDPSADFHDYKILWNTKQIVFYVDDTPIRVFANKENVDVGYPSQPMQIMGSLWNGDSWATDGGKTKVNWSYAPFNAIFQGFDVDGCVSSSSNDAHCSSSSLWWNSARYQQLSPSEKMVYENVRRTYMIYDYCDDVKRFSERPPECPQ